MEDTAPEVETALEKELAELLNGLPASRRREAVERASRVVKGRVAAERSRWVEACRRRAELWKRTVDATPPDSPSRGEARARRNEALYLADLLQADEDLGPTGPPGAVTH